MNLKLATLPMVPSSMQGESDSLADILRHQQLLVEVAESSGKGSSVREYLNFAWAALEPRHKIKTLIRTILKCTLHHCIV